MGKLDTKNMSDIVLEEYWKELSIWYLKYTDQNTVCFNCCPLTLDIMQAAGQIDA